MAARTAAEITAALQNRADAEKSGSAETTVRKAEEVLLDLLNVAADYFGFPDLFTTLIDEYESIVNPPSSSSTDASASTQVTAKP